MSRWASFYWPAIVAFLVALQLAAVWENVYWLILFGSFLPLLFISVYVVGFIYGLLGIEPFDKTRAFYTGWDLGMRLMGRTGKWH